MDRFEKGMLVRSKAGHDAGEIFIITGTEDAYVYLADGRLRTLQKPKKKKKKQPFCSDVFRQQLFPYLLSALSV